MSTSGARKASRGFNPRLAGPPAGGGGGIMTGCEAASAARAFAEVPARFARSKHAAPALYYQGECLFRADDLPGAVALYRKVIAEHPASDILPEVYYALGTAQQELAQDREAAATFQAA